MIPNTFCVTGMGRSGTKFLSQVLNLSETWDVKHEPKGGQAKQAKNVKMQKDRWAKKSFYGEVNSYMRWGLLELPVEKKAVILRDPYDLVWTIYNRKGGTLNTVMKAELTDVFKMLDHYITTFRVKYFYFEQFTRDPQVILKIAEHVGITDLVLPVGICDKPVNATPDRKKIAKTFFDLPGELQDWAKKYLGFYRKIYYDEEGSPHSE